MRVDYDKDQLAYALANALKERDEAREELNEKYIEYDQLFDEAEKIRIERDEAREKYDNLATEHMLVVNKLCEERDEARAEIQRLRLDAQKEAEHHDRMVKELEELYDKLKS